MIRGWELTCTGKSISDGSSLTGAVVTTWEVSTVSELTAVPVIHSTFINV